MFPLCHQRKKEKKKEAKRTLKNRPANTKYLNEALFFMIVITIFLSFWVSVASFFWMYRHTMGATACFSAITRLLSWVIYECGINIFWLRSDDRF